MKALSLRQAQNCETAKHPACKCRCRGALHGRQRGAADPAAQYFHELPAEDPHHIDSEAQSKEKKEAKAGRANVRAQQMTLDLTGIELGPVKGEPRQ